MAWGHVDRVWGTCVAAEKRYDGAYVGDLLIRERRGGPLKGRVGHEPLGHCKLDGLLQEPSTKGPTVVVGTRWREGPVTRPVQARPVIATHLDGPEALVGEKWLLIRAGRSSRKDTSGGYELFGHKGRAASM